MNDNPFLDNVRWFRVYNDTYDEIPSYAAMRFDGGTTWHANGQAFRVTKPNAASESDQDLRVHCFNGPFPISPASRAGPGFGLATQDWPCQALRPQALGAAAEKIALGGSVGLKSGQWYLSSLVRPAFRVLHIGDPLPLATSNRCWVAPLPPGGVVPTLALANLYSLVETAGSTVQKLPLVTYSGLTPVAFMRPIVSAVDEFYGQMEAWRVVNDTIEVPADGVYQITFGCLSYATIDAIVDGATSHFGPGATVSYRLLVNGIAPNVMGTFGSANLIGQSSRGCAAYFPTDIDVTLVNPSCGQSITSDIQHGQQLSFTTLVNLRKNDLLSIGVHGSSYLITNYGHITVIRVDKRDPNYSV